jgi:hypothetical protein
MQLSKSDYLHPARSREKLLIYGGDNRDRTGDLRLAKPALSQLSYIPDATKKAEPERLAALPLFWWA